MKHPLLSHWNTVQKQQHKRLVLNLFKSFAFLQWRKVVDWGVVIKNVNYFYEYNLLMVSNAVGMSTMRSYPWKASLEGWSTVKMLVFISYLSSIISMDNLNTQDGLVLWLSVSCWLHSTLGYSPWNAEKEEQG